MSRFIKMAVVGTATIAVLAFGAVVAMNAASSPPKDVGPPNEPSSEASLAPCPDSPNCVSSDASDELHAIEPLPLAESEQQTVEMLTLTVSQLPGSRSVLTRDNYLHFEFRSPWLGFVDDVEFLIDPESDLVHVRSASRVGRSDLGINRQRIEAIRRRYELALRKTEERAAKSVATKGKTAMPDEIDEFAVIEKSDEQWRKQLTPEQYNVTRKHGTERAFSGPNWDNKQAGIYSCVCCGLPLFSSETKYESGTGWPSFWSPLKETSVETQTDVSFFMRRTEVHCRRCKAHLGHVFEDGPAPTGLRYCMNGVAMRFEPSEAAKDGAEETDEQ